MSKPVSAKISLISFVKYDLFNHVYVHKSQNKYISSGWEGAGFCNKGGAEGLEILTSIPKSVIWASSAGQFKKTVTSAGSKTCTLDLSIGLGQCWKKLSRQGENWNFMVNIFAVTSPLDSHPIMTYKSLAHFLFDRIYVYKASLLCRYLFPCMHGWHKTNHHHQVTLVHRCKTQHIDTYGLFSGLPGCQRAVWYPGNICITHSIFKGDWVYELGELVYTFKRIILAWVVAIIA